MKYTKKQIDSLKYIQNVWKNTVNYKNDITTELNFFVKICNNLISSVEHKNSLYIIQQLEYRKSCELLQYCMERISIFPNEITFKYLAMSSKFKLLSNLAKIKLSLIELTGLIGGLSILDTINLYTGKKLLEIHSKKNQIEYINYLDQFYNVTKIDYYQSDNNNGFVIYNFSNKSSNFNNNTIKLKKSQKDNIILEKINIINKNITVRTFSSKLTIPVEKNLLIIYGYFSDDNLYLFKSLSMFKKKHENLKQSIDNIDVEEEYKNNFLKTLNTSEFIANSETEIINSCLNSHNDLMNLERKNISVIVKEFIMADIEKQRYIISNLLLNSKNNTSIYLSNLLLDLISSDSSINLYNTKAQILNSIHWILRKKITADEDDVEGDVKIKDYSEESIPYEKRINLMKADEYVKNKALDKLKEINNSKNGESTAKAQQYLDGLLKIPFGIYKTESIKSNFSILLDKIKSFENSVVKEIQFIEENYSLSDADLIYTDKLTSEINYNKDKLHNPLSLLRFTISIEKLIDDKIYDNFSYLKDFESFSKKMSSLSLKDLKSITNNLKLVGNLAKKNMYIKKLYDCDKYELLTVLNQSEKSNNSKYTPILNISEFNNIFMHINEIKSHCDKYNDSQKKYFNRLQTVLDNSVYGLDNAKIQIKRLLGQWINGNNQGYVFGFEGPPGTGKTTLAKTGISKCLTDEMNENRPFIFIALGGSSNGSTLEGHNYTYVGSSWGRIIEGIMDSKCMNPIIYIDELDKISRTEQGREIVGILTHLTDTSQNSEFTDKYFSGIKFDLSKCLIIFSYNDPSLIDKILLDRIQRIKIDPLNKTDKIMVCKNFIIPEIISNIGFNNDDVIISDEVISHIIDLYTYEAGARKLKEKLYELYREINIKYLSDGPQILPFNITIDFIDQVFNDYDKYEIKCIHKFPKVGLINGLYATSNGIGGITTIECVKYVTNSHLELKLTGMQGDVMKESMNVAKNLCLNLIPDNILSNISDDKEKFGIHIHCPSGGTPKDGPSAGTAITVCILSLLCNIPIKNDIAITGEINLTGEVLPIGGLDSKVEGGKSAGVKHIFAPVLNKKDLSKIRNKTAPPEDNDFSITLISNIYEALNQSLIFPNNEKAEEYFQKI